MANSTPRCPPMTTPRKSIGKVIANFSLAYLAGRAVRQHSPEHPTHSVRPPRRTPQCRKVFTAPSTLLNYCGHGANGVNTVRLVLQDFRLLPPGRAFLCSSWEYFSYGITVKTALLVDLPPGVVTAIFPVFAAAGTLQVSCLSEFTVYAVTFTPPTVMAEA